MIRTVAAATIIALLTFAEPAHATFVDPTYAPEVLDLNLTYPGGTTLTGTLDIGLGAPSVQPYVVGGGTLSENGIPLTVFGQVQAPGTFYIAKGNICCGEISFPILAVTDPNYGNPLNLTPSQIYFGAVVAGGSGATGTVTCTAECNDAVSPVPLPAAFPLFASALGGLGGVGWWKRRGKVSRAPHG